MILNFQEVQNYLSFWAFAQYEKSQMICSSRFGFEMIFLFLTRRDSDSDEIDRE